VGVAITSDGSYVLLADFGNHRVQVVLLVVSADSSSAHLEFIRFLGRGCEGCEEGQLRNPSGIALLPGEGGGQETVLVTELRGNCISQFALNGAFMRIFAGTGCGGSGNGEFKHPAGITVLSASRKVEVAIADCQNHRVQIFDSEGNYQRQFGSKGKDIDGHFYYVSGLSSDAHNNLLVTDFSSRLQLFSPKGKHFCTRTDLGLHAETYVKGVVWCSDGTIAIIDSLANKIHVWCAGWEKDRLKQATQVAATTTATKAADGGAAAKAAA
jgi:DNA-binding beta-propeller fold protein YncE